MRLHADKKPYLRRKADREAWEQAIDTLAMTLCPAEEWENYQRRVQQLSWRKPGGKKTATIKVFPVWRKYRQKALQVATLHQAVPLLRRMPLRLSCLLGDILFK